MCKKVDSIVAVSPTGRGWADYQFCQMAAFLLQLRHHHTNATGPKNFSFLISMCIHYSSCNCMEPAPPISPETVFSKQKWPKTKNQTNEKLHFQFVKPKKILKQTTCVYIYTLIPQYPFGRNQCPKIIIWCRSSMTYNTHTLKQTVSNDESPLNNMTTKFEPANIYTKCNGRNWCLFKSLHANIPTKTDNVHVRTKYTDENF